MATQVWESGAAPVAQVSNYTYAGTIEADDVTRIQIGNRIRDVTTGSTVAATVVGTLVTAYNALDEDDFPEFAELTASAATADFILTADEPGVPFTATLTPLEANLGAADAQTIEGSGTATTGTTTTASAGPNDWSTAANWSGGAEPGVGDTVHIFGTGGEDEDILYGLSNAGATVAAGHIWQSYTGRIGLPILNEDGGYPEYREQYLVLDCSSWTIGAGPGNGSGRIKINSGTVQTAVVVHNTGSPEEADVPALLWKGTHASNTMTVRGEASVGIAFFGGESATVATLTIDGNASVICGLGVTLTTINVNSGTLEVRSNIAGTLTVRGGQVTIGGTATVAQLTMRGGTVVYNSSGTISGATVLAGDAVLDLSQAPDGFAITNPVELQGPNCRLIDPNKRVTTLVVDFNEVPAEGQVEWGTNVRLTRGTPA